MNNNIDDVFYEADTLVRFSAVQMAHWEDQARKWRQRFITAIWLCGCIVSALVSVLLGVLWNQS